jgi:hypothetical protein
MRNRRDEISIAGIDANCCQLPNMIVNKIPVMLGFAVHFPTYYSNYPALNTEIKFALSGVIQKINYKYFNR